MSDNTILNEGSGGDTISTEDLGGVKITRVKLALGAHGTDGGDITSSNPVPVNSSSSTFDCLSSVTATTTATQLSSQACSEVWIQSDPVANVGKSTVYLLVGGATNQTIALSLGSTISFKVSNTNLIYVKSTSSTLTANIGYRS